jgi:glucose/arabinose dehydrogenase
MVPVIAAILLATLAATLTACGGGGGGGGNSMGSSPVESPPPMMNSPPPMMNPPTQGPGVLALTITGIPAGSAGAISVSGPNGFQRNLGASTALSALAPGMYTVSAANVLSGNALLVPQPANQSVQVTDGMTTAVTVAYGGSGAFSLKLQQVVSGLASPLFLTAPANDPRLFIVERGGRIRIVQNGMLLAMPFLDISTLVTTDGERGLLSMAFHPHYATNGQFFVYRTDLNGDIAIERYAVSAADANVANPGATLVLRIDHPTYSNHNGGLIAFAPDGMLYIGTGDGGGAGDPNRNAQNLGSLLGKLLRIDVTNTAGQPYAVPPSNPFVGQTGRRGEIWAFGLRNPWRYAFDPGAGELYIADVGQDRREEVDVVPAASAGLNFGWNVSEGTLCYPTAPCDTQGQTPPVFEYGHDAAGGCSITGGYVYRGNAIPELQGRYFYSDFCNGFLRSFVLRNGTAAETVDWNIPRVGNVLSFGEDAQRELYVLTDTFASSSSGAVYRIVRQ